MTAAAAAAVGAAVRHVAGGRDRDREERHVTSWQKGRGGEGGVETSLPLGGDPELSSAAHSRPAAARPSPPHHHLLPHRPPHLPPVAHQRSHIVSRRLPQRVQRPQRLQVPHPHLPLLRR